MMTTPRLRARTESGFTILEVLLALVIGAMILTPLFGGMLLTMESQRDASDRNDVASSVGLLRSYLQRDAAGAMIMLDTGDMSPDPSDPYNNAPFNTDCFGGRGEGQPVAIFYVPDENGEFDKVVYTLSQTLDDGGAPIAGQFGLWRRQCPMSTLQAESGSLEVFSDVAVGADGPRSVCVDAGCPTLRLSVTPNAVSSPAIITVSRRIGTESGVGDSSVSFGDLDVGITVDPVSGPRPIDQEITFTADLADGPVPDGHSVEWTLPDDTTATTDSLQRVFDTKGRFVVFLRITDPADGKFGTTMVVVTIGNEVPLLTVYCPGAQGEIGPDQGLERCVVPVGSHALTGSYTKDPDRDDQAGDGIKTYLWESLDLATAEYDPTVAPRGEKDPPERYSSPHANINAYFEEPGLRYLRFTATDFDGDSSSMLVPVLVTATDPVVSLVGNSPRVKVAGDDVTLTARAWYPDGTHKLEKIGRFEWAMQAPGGGDPTTWQTPMDCAPTQSWGGGFICSTQVKKNFSASSGSQQWVRVAAVSNFGPVSSSAQYNVSINAAPVANFSWSPSSPSGTTNVTFTSTSTDDVGISSYSWDFGFWGNSGWTSTATSPARQFTPGKYNVKLTVTDAQGDSNTKIKTMVVSGTPATPARPWRHADEWAAWPAVPGAEKYQYQFKVDRSWVCGSDGWSSPPINVAASANPLINVIFNHTICADYVYVRVRTVANGVFSAWSPTSEDIN